MTAYYNENDPRLTPWLYELMAAGVIAPGVVDTRSILDVRPGDLAPYTQCHFFAGIGVWSYALRLAGWPDDRRVWTGSCPCQPFSAAGKGAGFDDERHLWPAWFQLIAQCLPDRVYGEQVASKGGLAWLDLVHADLEAAGYSCGPVDLCAAGVGAPHIRQRLWFVAESEHSGRSAWHAQGAGAGSTVSSGGAGGTVADDDAYGRSISGEARLHDRGQPGHDVAGRGEAGHALANDERSGLQVRGDVDLRGADGRSQGGLAEQPGDGGRSFWSDCDWIPCRDGKTRPVEPFALTLVDGLARGLGCVRSESAATFENEVIQYARACNKDPRETMLDLWRALCAEAVRVGPFGRSVGVPSAAVLLAFLRQFAIEGRPIAQGLPRSGSEANEALLRGLWGVEVSACSPSGRGLDEQQPDEPSNALRVLSPVLARCASEAWGEAAIADAYATFPLAHRAGGRTTRLRAYGNAIVAQAAAEMIRATLP